MTAFVVRSLDRGATVFLALLAALAILVPLLNLLVPETWIIHVPNGESPFGGRSRFGDFTHEQAFTRGSLTQLLLASGFATVACYEDAPAAHGAKSRLRALLWRLIRLALRLYLAVETGDTGRNAIFSQNLLAVAVK